LQKISNQNNKTMKRFLLITMLALFILNVQAQDEKPKFGISFSGFVKNDFFWDSRQNTSIREGHFLLFPTGINRDVNGDDINAKANFNFLSIQTRLTGKITGPDAFGAKTSGVLEADFFGNENAYFIDANGFRLRHAYVKLNWKTSELLFGQFWHPLFNANSFPGVVSFNTGAPFQPFSRNPQIRYTQKLGNFNIIVAACSQRDFASPGGSSLPLRNSAIPDVSAQFQYGFKNDSTKTEFQIGLGGGYKILAPRLNSEVTTTTIITPAYVISDTAGNLHTIPAVTQSNTVKYKVKEQVGGFYAMLYAKYKCKPITAKLYGVYGQNIFDQVMLGGYVVSGTSNPLTGEKEYTPLNTLSTWAEIMTNGKKFQFGLFGGYTQNMGASDSIVDYSNTTRGADIKSIYRIAPRAVFISGKFQFMAELEWTSVFYATKNEFGKLNRDAKGVVTKSADVGNLRALFAVQYNF